jgi:glucuronoarabinoxylan endo-1,4-beta-xylanase
MPMHRSVRRLSVVASVSAAALTLAASLTAGPLSAAPTAAGSNGTAGFGAVLQPIDGFGFSAAFQRAALIHGLQLNGMQGLPPAQQRQVVSLLFSRTKGAGLSIVRLGIGSSADEIYDHMESIEPVSPGSPTATPQYVWDGNDGGQVWLAQQAKAYGVRQFYADAWSAPGYMKTNGHDAAGGAICGLPETSCASGDWRQAYANYLVQYVKFYRGAGIKITDLGFTNEPDFVATYASMQLDAAQLANMLTVLGPTVRASGLPLRIVCCDATGWQNQAADTRAIEADPAAAKWVNTYSAHLYSSLATSPQPTSKDVWMSEWQAGGTPWNQSWDDGTATSGMTLAQSINDTLTLGNADAYIYFFGASTGATGALMQLNGTTFNVSDRLWAMAAYSRYIRPGAFRVSASSDNPALEITAFRNRDGSKVLEIINTAATAQSLSLRLGPQLAGSHPVSYLTDNTHTVAREDLASLHGGNLGVALAPRSLTTVVLSGSGD